MNWRPALLIFGTVTALSHNAWREDLAYLRRVLPRRHENLFHTLPRAEFERELAALTEKLHSLSETEIRLELQRVLARVGDAHTSVEIQADQLHRFPFDFYRFSDGIYVLTAPKERAEVLGGRLVAIDETPIEQVESRLGQLASCENQACRDEHIPSMLPYAEYLKSQGLIRSVAHATFSIALADGREISLTASALPENQRPEARETLSTDSGERVHRLWLLNQSKPYWFEYVPEHQLLYFAYNHCAEVDALPFDRFQKELLAVLDTQAVQRVVVDLRRNSGGREAILRPLIRQLGRREVINRPDVLFVVIGKATYSSAALNAISFKEWTRATLVGEPTGQKPNSYGEMRSLTLPASGVRVNYSTKFWRRVEGDPMSVEPDLPAPQSFSEFAAGVDAAMRVLLAR